MNMNQTDSASVSADDLKNSSIQDDYKDYCIEGTEIVTYPLYRAFQVLWIIVAVTSLPYVIRVYWIYVKGSKLHRNIKILLLILHSSFITVNLTFAICQSYQLLLSITYVHPCDVFISVLFYSCMNITYGFSLELALLTDASMAVERVIATILAKSYEHTKPYPAIFGIVISVIVSAAVEFYLYYGGTFQQPRLSFLSSPTPLNTKIDTVLIFNTLCSIATTSVMIILVIMNKKRESRTIGVVAWHFQTVENIETTGMIAKLSFIQLLAFVAQSFGTLLIRFLDLHLDVSMFQHVPLMKATKLGVQVLPLFAFFVAAMIEYTIRSTASNRRERIKLALNVKDEAQHYSNFLMEQWNQKRPEPTAKSSPIFGTPCPSIKMSHK